MGGRAYGAFPLGPTWTDLTWLHELSIKAGYANQYLIFMLATIALTYSQPQPSEACISKCIIINYL